MKFTPPRNITLSGVKDLTHSSSEMTYISIGTNTINDCLVLRECKKPKVSSCDTTDVQQMQSCHLSSFDFIKVATTETKWPVL